MATLLEHFDREGDHKVLLFSYSTQVLDVLEAFAKSKGYGFVRLDGSTPSLKRQAVVRDGVSPTGIDFAILRLVV